LPINAEECKCGDVTGMREQFLLYKFTERNPGIQHKAGVPLGGTFVLVYEEEERRTPVRGPLVVTGRVTLNRGQPLIGATVILKNSTVGTTTNIDGSFRITIPAGVEAILIFTSLGLDTLELTLAAPLTALGNVTLNRSTLSVRTVYETRGGSSSPFSSLIVADFYLPYLCGSNCLPLQFVLPTERAETEICSYRWISSVEFLRRYDRNYRMRITKYEINGLSILQSDFPIRINIPKADINELPLQAIANEFNKVNGGVTFGVTTDGFNLTIRRAVTVSFLIEFTEDADNNYPTTYRFTTDGIVPVDKEIPGFNQDYYTKQNCRRE